MRQFNVWREPHPLEEPARERALSRELLARPYVDPELVREPGEHFDRLTLRLRVVDVADTDGPREAAVEWAHAIDLSAETAVCVREQVPGAEVTRWRVEPVTTYRARPA